MLNEIFKQERYNLIGASIEVYQESLEIELAAYFINIRHERVSFLYPLSVLQSACTCRDEEFMFGRNKGFSPCEIIRNDFGFSDFLSLLVLKLQNFFYHMNQFIHLVWFFNHFGKTVLFRICENGPS